ncbi:MAG: ATP-binding protein [Gammaproteobacteria bacterium]|nr:ATP-binding protein [Gammaproteobacteria bacterium]
MNNNEINQCLIVGNLNVPGVLPRVDNLKNVSFVFKQDFGLDTLPIEPGVIIIRGPRQYGKSTWLEQQIALTIKQFGPGTALYLNCDELINYEQLSDEIKLLNALFSTTATVKRLFIDEITAIPNWEKAIKRLIDSGELKDTLLITTGSKATDLRRGIERLPGRKGKLARTNYIFTPISFAEFIEKCGSIFKTDSLMAYILSGGSPIAANELATTGRIPEYISTIATDWILGEFAASGRSRAHLIAVLQSLYRMAGTPIGQAKLARESGLANNTLAQGYIDLLIDLMAVIPAFHYDNERQISLFRKPCKYHFINLNVALSWHPEKPRTIDGLKMLGEGLGVIYEWTVAQEIWRRICIKGENDLPEHLNFWQSKEHEIDFVLPDENKFIEVKSGSFNPMNFTWFLKNFQHNQLTVINKNHFDTERIKGITLEDFLLLP